MQIIPVNQSLSKHNCHIKSHKALNNINFKSNPIESVQVALRLLTTKEAKEYLESRQGQKFVKDLFHNTSVADLETIDILKKAFEEKKEYNKKFNEMVHYLAENNDGRIFMQT